MTGSNQLTLPLIVLLTSSAHRSLDLLPTGVSWEGDFKVLTVDPKEVIKGISHFQSSFLVAFPSQYGHRFNKHGKIPLMSIFACTVHLTARKYKSKTIKLSPSTPLVLWYTVQSAAGRWQLSAPSESGSGWRKTVHG